MKLCRWLLFLKKHRIIFTYYIWSQEKLFTGVGVKVLNAAFANTFQYMPPELMGTITEMHGAINQAYQKEVDQLTKNNWINTTFVIYTYNNNLFSFCSFY